MVHRSLNECSRSLLSTSGHVVDAEVKKGHSDWIVVHTCGNCTHACSSLRHTNENIEHKSNGRRVHVNVLLAPQSNVVLSLDINVNYNEYLPNLE